MGDSDDRSVARIELTPSHTDGPEVITAGEELQALLKDHLGEFRKTLLGKEKEMVIFDERLVSEDPRTLQEIGERFGISRERVRQLETRVTNNLRTFLQDRLGDVGALV